MCSCSAVLPSEWLVQVSLQGVETGKGRGWPSQLRNTAAEMCSFAARPNHGYWSEVPIARSRAKGRDMRHARPERGPPRSCRTVGCQGRPWPTRGHSRLRIWVSGYHILVSVTSETIANVPSFSVFQDDDLSATHLAVIPSGKQCNEHHPCSVQLDALAGLYGLYVVNAPRFPFNLSMFPSTLTGGGDRFTVSVGLRLHCKVRWLPSG